MRYCRTMSMSNKDVGPRIRGERKLREAFQGGAKNRNALEELRELMQVFADPRYVHGANG